MIVTIYKNCKLNNKYKDVFYNKTYLEGYLATLSNRIIVNDDEIFSRNNDSLYVDGMNIPDFKQYNFLKIVDSIGTFYAFINNIEWINEVYVINYEEDILSNYFELVHIRNSLLTRTNFLQLYKGQQVLPINYFSVPIESKSNNFFEIVKYNIANNDKPKIKLIVKLQFYTLDTQGNTTSRFCSIGEIKIKNDNSFITDDLNYGYSTVDKFIDDLINKRGIFQASHDFDNGGLVVNYYYDIDKIYAVPYDFIDIDTQPNYIKLFDIPDNVYGLPTGSYFTFNIIQKTITGYFEGNEFSINYDRKIDSIGLFSKPIKVINNGTNIDIKTYCISKGYGFSVIMEIQNKVIDITEDFLVDMPFTQASSSELQLQRLQLNLQENSLNNKIDNSNQELIKNKAMLGIGITEGLGSGIVSAITGNITGAISGGTSALKSAAIYGSGIEETKNDISYATERISMINRKIYCSSSILSNKFSYNNAVCGLCIFKVVEDNTRQIEQALKLDGYIVRELVNDVIQELDIQNLDTDAKYVVFKFDEVNLYGVIAQDYLRVIERVLLNGVRVWCQNDIGELI